MSRRAGALLALVLAATAACAPAAGRGVPSSAPLAPTLTSALGMEFVLIRPGTLWVGRFQPECPAPGAGAEWSAADHARCAELARRDARPGFPVRIEQPYYIGRYEVTQAEWRRVMGGNPSVFQGSRVSDDADRHPVDNVGWEEAQAFVRRLNQLDRTARYRLPTEFEWEYAARAGVEGEPSWASIRQQAQMSLYDKGTTRPVGQKTPNAWGLYDTLGNVWEWVQDHYNEKLFADPTPPPSGTLHVLKGGSFIGDVKNVTFATHAAGPGNRWDVGFRVVREAR